MSGALLQLAALGSQDAYLTGNPEITLFKKNITGIHILPVKLFKYHLMVVLLILVQVTQLHLH